MILGDSPLWERRSQNSVQIPLSSFNTDVVSFTYSDSYYAFAGTTLRGIPIPEAPHRAKLFVKDELSDIVKEFGLPPGYTDPDEQFDVYVEAQIWDDSPLAEYL